MKIPSAPRLARQFCRVLQKWLGPHQCGKAAARNRRQPDPNVCHSHDFCDANVAMLIACHQLGWSPLRTGKPDTDYPLMSEAAIDLWNQAWSQAKAARFRPEHITV